MSARSGTSADLIPLPWYQQRMLSCSQCDWKTKTVTPEHDWNRHIWKAHTDDE